MLVRCIRGEIRCDVHGVRVITGNVYCVIREVKCLTCGQIYFGLVEFPWDCGEQDEAACGKCSHYPMPPSEYYMWYSDRFEPIDDLGVTEEEVRRLYSPSPFVTRPFHFVK